MGVVYSQSFRVIHCDLEKTSKKTGNLLWLQERISDQTLVG